MRRPSRGATPRTDRLLELATELKLDAGLTVDLRAAPELGQPLVVVRLPGQPAVSSRFNDLTPREHEVAALIARGLSNKEIANHLIISVATVKDHVHHVLQKSGLASRAAVASTFRTRSPDRTIVTVACERPAHQSIV